MVVELLRHSQQQKKDSDNCDTEALVEHAGRQFMGQNARNQYTPRYICEPYGALSA